MSIPVIYPRLEPGVTQRKAEQVNVLYDDVEEAIYKQLGYLRENGAILSYVGTAAYNISSGAADVDGIFFEWESTISRTGLSLSANTLYYVYLYSNSGTSAVEESTTVPVWDASLGYYKKTGDSSRRCIGWIETNAASEIRNFLNMVHGRSSEIFYIDGSTTGRIPVNGGTVTTAWTSFSLAPLVPAHATDWYTAAKIAFGTAGDEAVLGLAPIDLGAVGGASGLYTVRSSAAIAGKTFFGRAWLPISASQTYYYRLFKVAGTTQSAEIEIHGARIIR